MKKIEIPSGTFCGGNCSTCIYFEARNTDSNGRGYCNWYSNHFFRQKDKVVLVTKEDNENCKSDRVSPVGFSHNKIAK